ncbi:MAG: HAD family hydrolase [Verrucomicrobiaceae bacterium]|nr:MAG: HAD family hydrolase [Verrucomicrobiaceae bacterium]
MMPLEEYNKPAHLPSMNREIQNRSHGLAFIDLDDTLLGPDKKISSDNLSALERLRAAGVLVTIASGRHHNNITALKQIGHQGWILSSHGSVVRNEQTGEVLAEMSLNPALVSHLRERAREYGVSVIAYHRNGAYAEHGSEWIDLYAREAGWKPTIASFDTLAPDQFQKILWSDHPDRINQLAPVLKAELSDRLNIMVTNPELLEFFAPTANKAVGAQALTGMLGIASEQTLAFGDGNNDVELLRWAGFSVAMHHGRETARQAARFVTPPGPPESAFARAVDLAFESGRFDAVSLAR